jgi:ribonuclease Z
VSTEPSPHARRRHAWAARELVVLGTAAQSPTPARNHNAYALRWGRELVLFDPGEGAQRQLASAGIPVSQLTRICITHAHGDHCLGLAGVLQRRSLDPVPAPIDLFVPSSMTGHVEAMLSSTAWDRDMLDVRVHALGGGAVVDLVDGMTLRALPLDHTIDTLGWRIESAPAHHLLPERLAALGIVGEDIGRFRREGVLMLPDGAVRVGEVSVVEPGPAFAFVMDTRPCEAAVELARGADLLVVESTYLDAEAALAAAHGHCTARQAATIAFEAGAHRLVLSHYSERHPHEEPFAEEAREVFADVTAARDFDVIRAPGTVDAKQRPQGPEPAGPRV